MSKSISDEIQGLIGDNTQGEALRLFSPTKIEALIEKSRLKGYNSGWVAASRVKPEKFAYFAKQLEDSAKKLRDMEAQLKKGKDNGWK